MLRASASRLSGYSAIGATNESSWSGDIVAFSADGPDGVVCAGGDCAGGVGCAVGVVCAVNKKLLGPNNAMMSNITHADLAKCCMDPVSVDLRFIIEPPPRCSHAHLL